MADCMGLPAVPDGSPSSDDRYWSPTYEVSDNITGLNKGRKTNGYVYHEKFLLTNTQSNGIDGSNFEILYAIPLSMTANADQRKNYNF